MLRTLGVQVVYNLSVSWWAVRSLTLLGFYSVYIVGAKAKVQPLEGFRSQQ